MIVHLYWSSCEVSLFCKILMVFKISLQVFEKYLHVTFYEYSSIGSRVDSVRTDGQTDTQIEANSIFS